MIRYSISVSIYCHIDMYCRSLLYMMTVLLELLVKISDKSDLKV